MPLPRIERKIASAPAQIDSGGSFERDVGLGLSDSPKHLDCRYFYDYHGSQLFEEICRLPEYYQTRTEKEILKEKVGEIAGCVPEDVVLVELGSGSSVKTRIIIEELIERQGNVSYTPIDISRSMLEESAAKLRAKYRGLEIVSVAAEYKSGLRRLRSFDKRPELILWLGSSIGNFERDEAIGFLRDIAADLSPDDRMLIGFDLVKDIELLERAYNDSRGITAAFNLNLLARINRELGGGFDIDSFEHIAEYNIDESRIEMYIVSRKDQDVPVARINNTFHFGKGERTHTENSHKYTHESIEEIANRAGVKIIDQWEDKQHWFNLTMLGPVEK
jgi:dimethylhistidine N-methyltransferase